jgi:hypothetical protein
MARPHGNIIRQNRYVAAGVIKIGDFVALNSAGKVAVAAAGSTTGILGIAMSYAKQADVDVLVSDSPSQEYLVERSSSAPSAQTDYNLNYDIVATTSSTNESKHTLDSSTGATTATLPLRAVHDSRVGASGYGPSECVVRINQHSERAGVAGV